MRGCWSISATSPKTPFGIGTARIEWGVRHPDGRIFGIVTLKNGDQRAFWDHEQLWPYVKAWQATKAQHDAAARMAEMVALGSEVPIGA